LDFVLAAVVGDEHGSAAHDGVGDGGGDAAAGEGPDGEQDHGVAGKGRGGVVVHGDSFQVCFDPGGVVRSRPGTLACVGQEVVEFAVGHGG
jgi:hypothetical protein